MGEAEVVAFLSTLATRGHVSASTQNQALSALVFLYAEVLNDRILSGTDGVVRFAWRDYADHDRRKMMALAVDEFLRRFLLHVLPTGFMRIRHFGLLANRTRHATLDRCRQVLDQPTPAPEVVSLSTTDLMRRLTGLDLTRCPLCGEGRMQITAIVARAPRPPDTS